MDKERKVVSEIEDLERQRDKLHKSIHIEEYDSVVSSESSEEINEMSESLKSAKNELDAMYSLIQETRSTIQIESIERGSLLQHEITNLQHSIEETNNILANSLVRIERLSTERYQQFHQLCALVNDHLSSLFEGLDPQYQCCISYSEDKTLLFENGVSLLCKPNKMGWKSVSQLSGGQQALCACALSLALQRVFPSSIFLCDELDASLDTFNIQLLLEFFSR